MRPTTLDFRSPHERTAEYKVIQHTHNGHSLDLCYKTKNATGTILPKEQRFKPSPLYCKGSGATCFLGPGSYNDHQAFKKLRKPSCPTKMVSFEYCLLIKYDRCRLHIYPTERVDNSFTSW